MRSTRLCLVVLAGLCCGALSACPNTCDGRSCDDLTRASEATCSSLERAGCDCAGCECGAIPARSAMGGLELEEGSLQANDRDGASDGGGSRSAGTVVADDPVCVNTDAGALDPYSDDCELYAGNPSWCGACE